jgi:Flp pilus assembly pilin Flp
MVRDHLQESLGNLVQENTMRKLRAQSFVEYGLLLAVIVVAVAAALLVFKGTLSDLFASVNSVINSAIGAV